MSRKYFLLYKPYGVLSQFTDSTLQKKTLGDVYPFPKQVYPVGRLDEDSEGLLILSDDPQANARLLGHGVEKEYWAQVEGDPKPADLQPLQEGVRIRVRKKYHDTLPAIVKVLDPRPELPERVPPIRYRKEIPDTWISLVLREGKNRQVRKMTAKVGFPTLRLVRVRIGSLEIGDLRPGEVLDLSQEWDWNWFR